MGEMAEGLLDGTFDSETGEYLGEGPGYPRTSRGVFPWESKWKSKTSRESRIDRIKKVVIDNKIYKKWHHVVHDYLSIPPESRTLDAKKLQDIAKTVCSNFAKFEQYCKSFNNKHNELKD
jgi:hypothetical protein